MFSDTEARTYIYKDHGMKISGLEPVTLTGIFRDSF
jgi:hypothetical protein